MFNPIWRYEVEMVLKGMVNIQDLSRHTGYHPSRYTKNQFKDKVHKIDGVNYIPKIYLTSKRDLEAITKCIDLDDYLPLSYCANYLLGKNRKILESKIKFQRLTNQKIYDLEKINQNYFIKIPKELQEKLTQHYSYAVTDMTRFKEYSDVKDTYIFGDDLIIFC